MKNNKYSRISLSKENEINAASEEIFEILKKSYEKIGGFLSAKNATELSEKCKYVCGFINKENRKICVVALYKKLGNSYKLFGCGTAHGSKEEKELLQSIIRTDIENYNKWHWAEVSGVLEHWFKKYNGYPIPSDFAQMALLNKTLFPLEDGFHYDRDINHYMVTKIMFGFTDQAFFDDIIRKYENYFELRVKINSTATVKENKEDEKAIIDYISSLALPFAKMIAAKTYYLTDNMIEQLRLLKSALKTVKSNDKAIIACRRTVHIMEQMGERLQSHSFAPIEKYIVSPAL